MPALRKCDPASRSDLLSLLSQACEFEHGLACSYLFTAFTLKQEIHEGLDWRQQQLARRWAADIFAVAAEEMLHLAQVWNLLAAVGGNPYYWRPEFPVRSGYYPTELPITLAPFSVPTLERFVQYELPDEEDRRRICGEHDIAPVAGSAPYGSVAELYSMVSTMLDTIPEETLFVGRSDRQVGSRLADFPTLVQVVDRRTAQAAVSLIKDQGEGAAPGDTSPSPFELLDVDRDGHVGVFTRVLGEFRAELARSGTADESTFVRNVIFNPIADARGDSPEQVTSTGVKDETFGHEIVDVYTREVARLFDSVYLLMLRLLQYVFRNSTDEPVLLERLASTAIGVMPTMIKPLAEALTQLRMGDPYGDKKAGPTYGLSRHVTLAEDPGAALTVVRERLGEMLIRADALASDHRAPAGLIHAARNLRYWSERLEEGDRGSV